MVRRRAKPAGCGAFTLVEIMVSTGVMALLAATLFMLLSRTSDNVHEARSNADEFEQAQRAFATLTQRIGQATLNNYRGSIRGKNWGEDKMGGDARRNQRMSDLRFACGPMQSGGSALDAMEGDPAAFASTRPGHGVFFQATTGDSGNVRTPALVGLENLVNTWGYFVEAGPDELPQPSILATQNVARRIAPRLMELREPTQRLTIYSYTSGRPEYSGFEWFRTPLADRTLVRTVVENIAALIVLPKLTAQETERLAPGAPADEQDALLAPQLFYHSGTPTPPNTAPARDMRHRLPAMVDLTMVALDSETVARLYHPDTLDPLNLRDAFHDAGQLRADLLLDPAQPDHDSLERRLIAARAHYRLFTATVPIRSAQ